MRTAVPVVMLVAAARVARVVAASDDNDIGMGPPVERGLQEGVDFALLSFVGRTQRPVGSPAAPGPYCGALEVVEAGTPAPAGGFKGLLREAGVAVGDVGDAGQRAVGVAEDDMQIGVVATAPGR